jgi:hypothetical protein
MRLRGKISGLLIVAWAGDGSTGAAKAQPADPEPGEQPEQAPPGGEQAEPAVPPEPAPPTVADPVTPALEPEPAKDEAQPWMAPPQVSAPPAPERPSWYESMDFRVFADAYAAVNYFFPKPQRGPQDEVRAYDVANGFALSWLGIDVSHPADPIGGTVSLRLGPTADRYSDSCLSATEPCDSDIGLQFVKQAFASWRPGGAQSPVRLDFGKFDTIYGAEVAESQDNINYTRGILYWLGQPRFHTGLRVAWNAGHNLLLTGLLANGYNNTLDNNLGKTAGIQLTFRMPREVETDEDPLIVSLGYLVGPERDVTGSIDCAPGTS